MKTKLKRPQLSSYGSLGNHQGSLPNLIHGQEESQDSDLEVDPVAHNYMVSNEITLNQESNTDHIINKESNGKCSYVIEPMAFIQNLSASIMNISVGQFIYNRIYNRLIKEANDNANHNATNSSNLNMANNVIICNMNYYIKTIQKI